MDANDTIKKLVDDHKKDYPKDDDYEIAIAAMAKLDLTDFSEADVENVIKPFLNVWGKMGRVLGREKLLGWEQKVRRIIKLNSRAMKRFQNMDIRNENLNNHLDEIETLYESFKEVVGSIASAKILHLVSPNFFPPWDNPIADGLRWELKKLHWNSFDKTIEAFSGKDYFRFMEGIKIFLSRHSDVISSLSNMYRQGELRIIDMCFWQAKRRPFLSIF